MLSALLALASLAAPALPGDQVTVKLDSAVRDAPATGRIVLFLVDPSERRLRRSQPARGPFWDPPQPVYSVAVRELAPGGSVAIDAAAIAWPAPLDELDGTYRVQALLDADATVRSPWQGAGNAVSPVVEVEFRADAEDRVELVLEDPVRPRPLPPESDHLRWVEVDSPILSAHYGRPIQHRAGVALPPGYDDPEHAGRHWAAIYDIPGYGGTHAGAVQTAAMMATPNIGDYAPMAVHIVLDPDGPLGHHGFCDSAANGPRGRALVEELVPELERRFRLFAEPAARITTGHSSGGWSSLWLALEYPETFGACWSTAPDPVDFTAFQMSDIYADASMFVLADGSETPSMRAFASADTMRVAMTVREENGMERAVAPDGTSGEQWDAWESMFSPVDPESGLPRPLFDALTGAIARPVAEHWRAYDIAARVRGDWDRYGPLLMGNVRLICGGLDSFYLERAVERLKSAAEAQAEADGGWKGDGYILIVPDESHGTLRPKVFQRINEEMRKYLAEHGY